MSTEASAAHAATLHRQAVVMDMTMPLLQGSDYGLLFGALERMRRSGYDFVSLTIAADHTGTGETLRNMALLRALLLGRGRNVRLVRRASDIGRARAEGRLAVGLHFQGTVPIGTNLSLVGLFYRLGIRHMLMAYNTRNRVGSGCHDAVDEGLTLFGRSLIQEMNRGWIMSMTCRPLSPMPPPKQRNFPRPAVTAVPSPSSKSNRCPR